MATMRSENWVHPNPPIPAEERKRNKLLRLSPVTLSQIERCAEHLETSQAQVVERAMAAMAKKIKLPS